MATFGRRDTDKNKGHFARGSIFHMLILWMQVNVLMFLFSSRRIMNNKSNHVRQATHKTYSLPLLWVRVNMTHLHKLILESRVSQYAIVLHTSVPHLLHRRNKCLLNYFFLCISISLSARSTMKVLVVRESRSVGKSKSTK